MEPTWQKKRAACRRSRDVVMNYWQALIHTTKEAKEEASLQVAESCLEISGAVLTEVQRQGESLDKTEKHMEEMEEEVVEAESLIKFMQKCCLFQVFCCCCTDKDVKRDKSRKARLRQRREENERMIQALSRAREDRHRDLHELLHDEQGPPIVTMDGETSEQKDALKVAAKYHHGTSSTATIPFSAQGHGMSQRSNAAVQSGAITAEEIQEISEETLQQDKYLTQIDKTMDKLKARWDWSESSMSKTSRFRKLMRRRTILG
eukprot:jgi/Picre1/28597/NNA_003999.t1